MFQIIYIYIYFPNNRFKLDGIEYQNNVQATDNVLPFSGTGNQRVKHTLIEGLIPGNAEALPVHVLSQTERCILHQAISNSIVKVHNESKYKPCSQITQQEKLAGNCLEVKCIYIIVSRKS